MHVKKGDTVKILSGDDRGKTATVARVLPKQGKVVVEGMNMVKKHERSRREGGKGQIIDLAMPMHASKVAKVD